MSAHDTSTIGQNLPLENPSRRWRMTYGVRQAGLRSTHGLPSAARVRRVYATVWWPSPAARLLVSRSVSLSGVRSIDLPREPARHRDVSACLSAQALSCRLPGAGLPEHLGRCQPDSRLAYLRRLRPSPD